MQTVIEKCPQCKKKNFRIEAVVGGKAKKLYCANCSKIHLVINSQEVPDGGK